MRSRTNANVHRSAPPSSSNEDYSSGANGIVSIASPDEDSNGKDKLRKRNKFKLPPPPQMMSLANNTNVQSTRNNNGSIATVVPSTVPAAAPQIQQMQSSNKYVNQNPYQTTSQPNFSQISQPYRPNNLSLIHI